MKRALREVAVNARLLLFIIGFGAFYVGISRFSPAAANIAAGALLMAIGAGPYLARRRKG